MSKISENFETLLAEKEIPVNHKEINGGNHLYRVVFQLDKGRKVVVEAIIQDSDKDYVDAQVVYRHVHMLGDRSKEPQALEMINDLNGVRTGYYNLYLAGDGEIFLRSLSRVGEDVTPLYETLVMGSGIVRTLLPDIEKRLGESAKRA